MTWEIEQGDIQAAIAAGRREVQVVELFDGVKGIVRPDSGTGSHFDVIDVTEDYGEAPRRPKGNVTVRTVEDFVAYVKRHEYDNTVVFADDHGGMRAVIDHHGPEAAGWRDFTATLQRQKTVHYEAWMKASQGEIPQEAFANFLEERIGEIVEPDGGPLLDAAEHFRAHKIVSFRSQNKLSNGQRQLEYVEEVQGGNEQNGSLRLPERLTLLLQPFRDSDSFNVEVRLRWRLSDKTVLFRLLFDDQLKDRLEEVYEAAIAEVDTGLIAPVLRGQDS